jgi:Fanconi anemia group J protein
VVVEPRESGKAFELVMASYTRAVETGRGGLLMAVCRGKVKGNLPNQ